MNMQREAGRDRAQLSSQFKQEEVKADFKTHFIKALYPIYISSSANSTVRFFTETLLQRATIEF